MNVGMVKTDLQRGVAGTVKRLAKNHNLPVNVFTRGKIVYFVNTRLIGDEK